MTPTSTRRSPARWLTHVAFLLALVMVIARMTTVDALRDPWDPSPAAGLSPHGPGPATALIFDLLTMVPALLVLARRAIDTDFRLTPRWSHLPMFLLAIWAALSTAWSADKFAAAVTSAHLFACACLLWAMSQLVRSWVRFRLVAAVSFGLLVLLVVQSLMYKFVDVPENLAYWHERKADILKQHNWAPDSFEAKQFERKITSGETAGFFTSPNTLAAVSVLLFAACVGIGIQKLIDGEDPMWLALPIVAGAGLIWLLIEAASKTAGATPFIGCAIIALFIFLRDRLRRFPGTAYAACVAVVATGLLAVVVIGLTQHGLFPGHFSDSLDFRWKYWVASAGIFKSHPLVGIGWSNFGLHYLAHRLPEASEEIKDPHNFLVRIFVELGLIGGLLLLAWLLRLAWELTRPCHAIESPADENDESATIASPIIIVTLGMLISTVASMDFNQAVLDTIALLLRPILLFLTLLLGTMAAAMRSPQTWQLDTRRAPWIFYCLVVGLGLFLLHNLIDFSWFEAGPMAMFMLLIGAALGMAPIDETAPKNAGSEGLRRAGRGGANSRAFGVPQGRRLTMIAITIVAVAGWMTAAILFVGPVVFAEGAAASANDSITTAPADRSIEETRHYAQAAKLLAAAAATIPYNPEYTFRQAKALLGAGDLAAAESLVQRAKKINPLYIDAYLLDANLQLKAEPKPDANRVRSDFDTIIRLNPNDVSFHAQYAQALDRFGDRRAAARQYELAIRANAALPVGEPRRLTPEQLADLREHLLHDEHSN